MKPYNKHLNKIKGSIVAGAVGDALGYPVEFMSHEQIIKRYGSPGITRHELREGKALISDDTQMTLFTACGILNSKRDKLGMSSSICRAYIEWLYTQGGTKKRLFKECSITGIKELNANRAPGITCISSLTAIANGREHVNSSKGCGGVMRIAPIPLFGMAHNWKIEECCTLAADASEITHQHPLGYLPSALLSYIIFNAAEDDAPSKERLQGYIMEGLEAVKKLFPHTPFVKDLEEIVGKAKNLANTEMEDIDAITKIGEGWVAEETLAIAIYCALKYWDNVEKALVASVNHSGDSDSTGAVTGNIIGALLGYDAIPDFYKENLELRDLIEKTSEDLA